MLLVCLVASIAPETHPRIPELQGETGGASFCMSNELVLIAHPLFATVNTIWV